MGENGDCPAISGWSNSRSKLSLDLHSNLNSLPGPFLATEGENVQSTCRGQVIHAVSHGLITCHSTDPTDRVGL